MEKNRLKERLQRKGWLVAGFLFSMWGHMNVMYAQSSEGSEAFNSAATMVGGYYDPIKKLVWAIAGVLGLVGAVRLYNKYTSADPEASKNAAAFVGGAIALVVAEAFVRKVFINA